MRDAAAGDPAVRQLLHEDDQRRYLTQQTLVTRSSAPDRCGRDATATTRSLPSSPPSTAVATSSWPGSSAGARPRPGRARQLHRERHRRRVEFDRLKQQLARLHAVAALHLLQRARHRGHRRLRRRRDAARRHQERREAGRCPREAVAVRHRAKFAGASRDRLPAKAAASQGRQLLQRLAQTLEQLKGCLAGGFPFVFGFAVYESFESTRSPRPARCRCRPRRALLGGHAVLAVGYDEPHSASSSATPGAPTGARTATSRCPTPTCPRRGLSADFWTMRSSPDLRGGAGDRRGGTVIPGPLAPLLVVDQRVAGQAEDALADLVALDLRRAAGDRHAAVHQHQRRRSCAPAPSRNARRRAR